MSQTPLISRIELQIGLLLGTISKANNYSLNWAPCNIEDRALESLYNENISCYPVLNFLGEDSLQTNKDNFADKYENKIRYQLQVRYVMRKEFADPKFIAAMFNQKAIEDFKKLLANKNSLDLNFVQKVIYKNSKTLNDNNIINVGDRFCPIYSEINFEVYYNQSRSNVFKGAC